MKLSNIKVSFFFQYDLIDNIESKVMWKYRSFSYTIYQHTKKLLNITGAKSKADIQQQKISMEKMFHQKVLKVRIDNVFFSQKHYKNLDMCALYEYLRMNQNFFINYNIERFAGMYLHPRLKNHPTIVLFRTGSYQIMGGKSLSLGYRSEVFVKRLIDRFEKKCASGHPISEKV